MGSDESRPARHQYARNPPLRSHRRHYTAQLAFPLLAPCLLPRPLYREEELEGEARCKAGRVRMYGPINKSEFMRDGRSWREGNRNTDAYHAIAPLV